MAEYDMKPRDWARIIPALTSIQSECDKRKTVNAEKNKKNEDLYDKGANWYIQGKKLEDAKDSVIYNGRKMTDEELKFFTNGFLAIPISKAKSYAKVKVTDKDKDKYNEKIGFWFGKSRFDELPGEFNGNSNCVVGFGKGYGYDGASINELPKKYVGKKAFLMGYRSGIQARACEEKESKKRR